MIEDSEMEITKNSIKKKIQIMSYLCLFAGLTCLAFHGMCAPSSNVRLTD